MEYAQTVFVTQAEPKTGPDIEADLRRARVIATLMDAQFDLAGVKFGMDAIVGLVPGVGDFVTMMIGTYPLFLARRHGLGKWVAARMAGNLIFDFVAGSVPVVGDVFDVAFKANLKNLALLEKAIEKKRRVRT